MHPIVLEFPQIFLSQKAESRMIFRMVRGERASLPKSIDIYTKVAPSGSKIQASSKKKIFLKDILYQHRNYVVKHFYPKLSHSLICIKIPYSKIPNNAPRLPAKILTFLCFEIQQI